MFERAARSLVTCVGVLLISVSQTLASPNESEIRSMRVHYVEIVCQDAAAQCKAFEQAHGLSFGAPNPDLGNARVAKAPDGTSIAVRAPLADHDTPIVRTYWEVEDIAKAVKDAESAGAMIAYPPTKQGDTGTWAIYILGGLQFGLWQR